MEHRPYPRTYRAASGPAAAARWVATEKVHGANLVVATDGRDVRVGKRKAWLRDDEPFFGWQFLGPALARAALDLWRDLGEPTLVRLHGELYGGAYPPPAVVAVPGNSLVQTGVWYAPDVRLSAGELQARSASLMTAARVASARSKVGPDNPVALCDEAALDALVDLEAAFPRAMGALDEAAMEGLRAALVEQARAWLTVG
jgi:hypothetical protein